MIRFISITIYFDNGLTKYHLVLAPKLQHITECTTFSFGTKYLRQFVYRDGFANWYCQAQPQLNSTQLKLRLRLALFPAIPATHPPNRESSKMEQDFKYLDWRLQILQLKSSNTCEAQYQLNFNSSSASTQLNINSTQPQLKLLSLALLSSSLFCILLTHYQLSSSLWKRVRLSTWSEYIRCSCW